MSIISDMLKNTIHDAETKFAPEIEALESHEERLELFFSKFDNPAFKQNLCTMCPGLTMADCNNASEDFKGIKITIKQIATHANL